jgi:hypothetical protein
LLETMSPFRDLPILKLQESGTGRRPALSPLVIGQQLSGCPNITANSATTGHIHGRSPPLESQLTAGLLRIRVAIPEGIVSPAPWASLLGR